MEPNRVAVIFGGASGIGRAVAEACVKRGLKVAIADVNETLLEEARKQFPKECMVVRCDATNEKDVKQFADAVYAKWNDCGLLMNNTGIMRGDSAFQTSLTDWQMVMKLTFEAHVIGTNEFVPRMLKQANKRAVVVNTSSVSGLVNSGKSTGVPYTIAKHASRIYSESLAIELANTGISVHVLCPGPVKTRLMMNSKTEGENFEFERRPGGINQEALDNGLTAEFVAEKLIQGIAAGLFYIVVTKSDMSPTIMSEMMHIVADDVADGTGPLSYMTATGDKRKAYGARFVAAAKRKTKAFL